MSLNNKFRTLANLLPYFPRTNSKGELVISSQYIMGADMLARDPDAKDKDGKPIRAKMRYREPIVICADHFEELKKAFELSGEAGVREYCDKVKAYDAQKNQPSKLKKV